MVDWCAGQREADLTHTIRENYDRLAKEYARRLFDELQHKPFDREVLTRFAEHTKNRGTGWSRLLARVGGRTSSPARTVMSDRP